MSIDIERTEIYRQRWPASKMAGENYPASDLWINKTDCVRQPIEIWYDRGKGNPLLITLDDFALEQLRNAMGWKL